MKQSHVAELHLPSHTPPSSLMIILQKAEVFEPMQQQSQKKGCVKNSFSFKDAIKGREKIGQVPFSYAPFYEIVLSLNLPSWQVNQKVKKEIM